MLSFPAVHTLAGCLLAADADAETLGWGSPPTLLREMPRSFAISRIGLSRSRANSTAR